MNEFGVLGPVRVVVHGATVAFARPQHRDLFALLLLHANRAVAVEQVIDSMWGGAVPATAPAQVQNMVSAIRSALARTGPAVATLDHPRAGYLLRVNEPLVDLNVFDSLVGQARTSAADQAARSLREAMSLWRGRPLADVRAAYAVAARARLDERRGTAIEALFDAELECGRHAQVLPEIGEALDEHPFRERLVGQLMTALYRSGRQTEALAAYRNARRALIGEHGLEPSGYLRRLEQLVLRNDPALDVGRPAADRPEAGPPAAGPPAADTSPTANQPRRPTAPATLPRACPGLVGRPHEAEALTRLLAEPGTGPIVVSGMPGVGKTALAVHGCRAVAGSFPDGQLFVDLGGVGAPVSAHDALGQLLAALSMPHDDVPSTLAGRIDQYRSRLAGTRTLVLLDDADSAAQVRPLLPGDPGCSVVVTSRRRLDELLTTEHGHRVRVDVLPDEDARRMLDGVAGRTVEPAAVEGLVQACGGLPLALRVAATRLTGYPGRPVDDTLAIADENSSLHSTFDASYRALPPAAARLLLMFGLHPGGNADVHALAAMAKADLRTLRRPLETLVDAHLVRERDDGGYDVHPLVAAYTRSRTQAGLTAVERHQALLRMLDCYLVAIRDTDRLLAPHRIRLPSRYPADQVAAPSFADPPAALRWLTARRPALLAVTHFAATRSLRPHAWQLPYLLQTFFSMHQHWTDWADTHREALAALHGVEDERAMAVALATSLGECHAQQRRYHDALTWFRRALGHCDEDREPGLAAACLHRIADVLTEQGLLAEATDYLDRARALSRQAACRAGEAPRQSRSRPAAPVPAHPGRGSTDGRRQAR
jgi:DNA-binding SARP family transcriptional activator/tetratricopeptide (TPR) repeat protein